MDVAQDVIIREDDCGTDQGIPVPVIDEQGEPNQSLAARCALEAVVDPKTGEILVDKNEMIEEEATQKLIKAKIESVMVRSLMTCEARYGVCSFCYGRMLATDKLVEIGEAVGIIAAQSIGEPGTQLTMRTFHTGGVAGRGHHPRPAARSGALRGPQAQGPGGTSPRSPAR